MLGFGKEETCEEEVARTEAGLCELKVGMIEADACVDVAIKEQTGMIDETVPALIEKLQVSLKALSENLQKKSFADRMKVVTLKTQILDLQTKVKKAEYRAELMKLEYEESKAIHKAKKDRAHELKEAYIKAKVA